MSFVKGWMRSAIITCRIDGARPEERLTHESGRTCRMDTADAARIIEDLVRIGENREAIEGMTRRSVCDS